MAPKGALPMAAGLELGIRRAGVICEAKFTEVGNNGTQGGLYYQTHRTRLYEDPDSFSPAGWAQVPSSRGES